MAEVIGTIASVAQLIQLSGALLAGGYGFLSKVTRAPSEIRSLLTETAAINSLLGQLQIIADSNNDPTSDDALRALERLGVFQECQETLKSIQQALATCEHMHGNELKNFGRRLLWPFKEKETKEALQRLNRLRGLLANAVEANSASALRRIEATQGVLVDTLSFLTSETKSRITREERHVVLSWICPLPSDGAHNSLDNALRLRLPGTGSWFLQSEKFIYWMKSDINNIWITGLPGSGKSILISSIIQEVQSNKNTSETPVLFFFCDHRDSHKRTLEGFLMNITHQILDISPTCLEKVKDIYEERGKNFGRAYNRAGYLHLINSFLCYFKEVSIIVDALDEATEAEQIADAMVYLHNSGQKQGLRVKTLFSSRFDVNIERKYPVISSNRVALSDNMRQDIDTFVKAGLDVRIAKGVIKLRDRSFAEVIQREISARAGTVLQARLQLDYISAAKTDKDLKDMVQRLPSGLDYTYNVLLCSMAARYPTRVNEMRTLLQCLTTVTSPLSASQLAEIMTLQPSDRVLDFDSVPTDPYDSLEVVSPFVVVDREHSQSGVIKLNHYSLDEYLMSEQISTSSAKMFHVNKQQANTWLASKCLQYLSLHAFDGPLEGDPEAEHLKLQNQYAFLKYASLNWYKHMAEGLPDMQQHYEPYIKHFINAGHGPPCYSRWQFVFTEAYPFIEAGYHSPICFAIWADLEEVFDYLLPMLQDVNQVFADGFTCLTVAAMYDHVPIAQKLLECGAEIDLATSDRKLTPLHLASEFGCTGVFNLLLEAGADPHARSRSESTPFYRACRGGNTEIVQRLKGCGCDINATTWNYWTPMMEAVENRHEDVVDLLLQWGADLTIADDESMTAANLADSLPNFSIAQKIRQAMGQEVGGGEP